MLVLGATAGATAWATGHRHSADQSHTAKQQNTTSQNDIAMRRTAPSAPVHRTSPALAATGAPQLPDVRLAGLRWSGFYGVQLPSSPPAGPRVTRGGLASGFADTPLGALLAAVNIAVRANAQWGPAIFIPTISHQVTGPDTPALMAACEDTYRQGQAITGVRNGQPLGRAYVTEEGFRWQAYTPQGATLDIVSAGPGDHGATVRAATRIEVEWRGRDWQVVAPPGGDWGNSATQLTSLDGYTTFPASAG